MTPLQKLIHELKALVKDKPVQVRSITLVKLLKELLQALEITLYKENEWLDDMLSPYALQSKDFYDKLQHEHDILVGCISYHLRTLGNERRGLDKLLGYLEEAKEWPWKAMDEYKQRLDAQKEEEEEEEDLEEAENELSDLIPNKRDPSNE